MKKIIYALILLASWPSFARQFDVEVIIFKRNVEPSSFQESWPDLLDPINLGRAFSYRDKAVMNKNNAFLISDYKLSNVYKKLQNHAGFKPLVHVAWRQGDSGSARSPIFHVQAGQNFSNRFVADGRTLEDAKADINLQPLDAPVPTIAQNGEDNQLVTGSLLELDGTLQVYVQHYLYVKTELDLKIPGQHEFIINTMLDDQAETVNEINTDIMPIQELNSNVQFGHLEDVTPETEVKEYLKSYRIKEKRKMRSGETHYIDHPLMGMIIQVRKV
ncbi:putative exported protein [Aliivibrio wodanis]|uniref:Putative exported protein n=1 Tax=Aliivibrio wodanis TaxID=80852 RepID=A0A090ICE6_9GAMM|nr:putative exported protein [Aliivibrio wodanis]VVV06263.1 hypothetical protein AW0309160_03747 [Aliivibrio wodanis]